MPPALRRTPLAASPIAPKASPVAPAVGTWPVHMSWREHCSLENKLSRLAIVSCSAASLGIAETNSARLPAIDLQTRWDKRYKNRYRTAFTIWMDCRIFTGDFSRHSPSGEHFRSIFMVASHPKFLTWLEQFKDEFTSCLRLMRPGDTMKVVCYCGDGQWRSVACTRIITYILGLGADPAHMQFWYWVDQSSCSWHCDNEETRDELQRQALQICNGDWLALFCLTNQCLKQRVPPEERVAGLILEPAQRMGS